MKTITFLFLFLCPLVNYAQQSFATPDCTTEEKTEEEAKQEPWYADETFLPNYKETMENEWSDSLGFSGPTVDGLASSTFRIPVTFWIYRDGITDNTILSLSDHSFYFR